ncbi:carboxypeptidase A [Podospora didyma]|uniref:Carboxypeptidase A n=1 Tax=Podospora didyma TaxID=330526 RepID=A0AAE0KDM7_9PEZI|nr:carboxypeptidase A [Podospora didyma]
MKTPLFLTFASHFLAASACLTELELKGGHIIDLTKSPLHRRQFNNFTRPSVPVTTGDRFNGGKFAPRGIGSQKNAVFDSILNVHEIQSAIKGLVKEFGVEYFETPYKTYENTTMFGAKIGGGKSNRDYHVLLQSGIHARERGGPDALIYLISDLLWAKREKKGLVYGGMSYTYDDVKSALDQGIVILPLVNPDGVAFDHATDLCWRKNRNASSATPGIPSSVGVDLNRNFGAAWDFRTKLAPTADLFGVSDDPESEVFHGTGPLSEAETRNVDWTMGQFPNLGWFVDLHSFAGVVLHGSCFDSNQARDKTQNMLNPAFDGKRGLVPDDEGHVYKEYVDQDRWDTQRITAAAMASAMVDATNSVAYAAKQSVHLYPTTGCASEHGNYRARVGKRNKDIHGFTIEFGDWNTQAVCPFYPDADRHRTNLIENAVGFMELLISAARMK